MAKPANGRTNVRRHHRRHDLDRGGADERAGEEAQSGLISARLLSPPLVSCLCLPRSRRGNESCLRRAKNLCGGHWRRLVTQRLGTALLRGRHFDGATHRPSTAYCRRFWRVAIRASIGGWVENRAIKPGLSLIPNAWIDLGSSPGSTRPRVASALIMLLGCPM